mmetsp:Transcript_39482/g.63155  ORF Transcript_39482/g.63155 Transcript_39482/m.63155 type:complete len:309 (+) Transcript_39482:102-1028(+)
MADRYSAAELAAACGLTEMEAAECIAQFDEDGDGTLAAQDFEDLKSQIIAQQQADGGDGRLSAEELAAACNITPMEAQNIIMQYDADGDGTLNPDEFEDLKQQILKQQREAAAQQIDENTNFQQMDDNKDNRLSAKELAAACNITELQASNLIQQYDVNNDGYLNEEEFDTLKQQILKEQAAKLQQERQQRQAEQNAQYNANKNAAAASGGDDAVQEFKHKWKFGMNFDPKNENVVIYVSDEVTSKNWGTTLKKNDFNGPIRQEYRKLGGVISSGTIKYDYPKQGGPLQVHIMGKNGEEYHYSCPQQM